MKSFFKNLVQQTAWLTVQEKAKKEHPTVIAVTGSVGKTSAKDAIAEVLAAGKRPVTKTYGNLNTEIGVPLSLLGYKEAPDSALGWIGVLGRCISPSVRKEKDLAYVLEYSAERPGDINFLTKKLTPNIAILTLIAPSHLEFYKSFDDLIKEKWSLIESLPKDGVAILNAADPIQVERGKGLAQAVWYGVVNKLGKQPGVWAHDFAMGTKGLQFKISFVGSSRMDGIRSGSDQTIQINSRVIAKYQVTALLVAAAVGRQCKVSIEAIKKGLEAYELPAGRGRLIEGQKNTTIIDDSYNAASPESVKAGLVMAREFSIGRRLVAILGNMNELGDASETAHLEVATFAADKVDFLAIAGPQAEGMMKAAIKAGLPSHQVIAFSTPEQLIDKLSQLVQSKDVIYVKGSQNKVRLERAVKVLMAHPEKASELLVRQSARWKDHI